MSSSLATQNSFQIGPSDLEFVNGPKNDGRRDAPPPLRARPIRPMPERLTHSTLQSVPGIRRAHPLLPSSRNAIVASLRLVGGAATRQPPANTTPNRIAARSGAHVVGTRSAHIGCRRSLAE